MQTYTPQLASKELHPQAGDVVIGDRSFHAEIDADPAVVRERSPSGEKTYPMEHVMGGKNVYYFLTPLERGRLQVLPIAYDVHKKSWYDTAASGVRHFPDRQDQALDWTDRLFTFNTTCFNCHVSQLATNYDLKSDTYRTSWSESGISCESCHGPASEHVRLMELDPAGGHNVKDLKIIRTKDFSVAQMNDMCATCHAKMVPISTSFKPGDPFFDHFDLLTLEHPDFYPDGRDLGENYTLTSWMMSPCVRAGKLDCTHCHTGSGRPQFESKESSRACLPCHEARVKDPVTHGHHTPGSAGNECLACHMPSTRFAAMGRTDHSMRPPTPALSMEFGSPNACNLCHLDKQPTWADEWVRKWYKRDYQAAVIRRARLLDAARKDRWQELPAMIQEAIASDDPIWKNAMVRVLHHAQDPAKGAFFQQLLRDPSPLVRSSAATALGEVLTDASVADLIEATRDTARLVRIRAAQSLAALSAEMIRDNRDRASLAASVEEFRTAMRARPDDWASHANLGNFAMEAGDLSQAIAEFETAHRLEPRVIGPLVNAATAYNRQGLNREAEDSLRRALKIEPADASVNFNLGLLLGELNRLDAAEACLRTALKTDPKMAPAAYNLGVIVSKKSLSEGLLWCRMAYQLHPTERKYAGTLAFYQRQAGDRAGAVATLSGWLAQHPGDIQAALALGQLHEETGDRVKAERVYEEGLRTPGLPAADQSALKQAIGRLRQGSSAAGTP
jgi:tetratricopeptide (TPR) repeat protein